MPNCFNVAILIVACIFLINQISSTHSFLITKPVFICRYLHINQPSIRTKHVYATASDDNDIDNDMIIFEEDDGDDEDGIDEEEGITEINPDLGDSSVSLPSSTKQEKVESIMRTIVASNKGEVCRIKVRSKYLPQTCLN